MVIMNPDAERALAFAEKLCSGLVLDATGHAIDPTIAHMLTLKAERLECALKERAKVQRGDLIYVPDDDDLDLCLVVCQTHDQNPRLWLVIPGDDFEIVGSQDVGVPANALGGPLVLRGGEAFYLDERAIAMATRVGVLEEIHLDRAMAKRMGRLPACDWEREADKDPAYESWMESLHRTIVNVQERVAMLSTGAIEPAQHHIAEITLGEESEPDDSAQCAGVLRVVRTPVTGERERAVLRHQLPQYPFPFPRFPPQVSEPVSCQVTENDLVQVEVALASEDLEEKIILTPAITARMQSREQLITFTPSGERSERAARWCKIVVKELCLIWVYGSASIFLYRPESREILRDQDRFLHCTTSLFEAITNVLYALHRYYYQCPRTTNKEPCKRKDINDNPLYHKQCAIYFNSEAIRCFVIYHIGRRLRRRKARQAITDRIETMGERVYRELSELSYIPHQLAFPPTDNGLIGKEQKEHNLRLIKRALQLINDNQRIGRGSFVLRTLFLATIKVLLATEKVILDEPIVE